MLIVRTTANQIGSKPAVGDDRQQDRGGHQDHRDRRQEEAGDQQEDVDANISTQRFTSSVPIQAAIDWVMNSDDSM
jgi:hypothetical protein